MMITRTVTFRSGVDGAQAAETAALPRTTWLFGVPAPVQTQRHYAQAAKKAHEPAWVVGSLSKEVEGVHPLTGSARQRRQRDWNGVNQNRLFVVPSWLDEALLRARP